MNIQIKLQTMYYQNMNVGILEQLQNQLIEELL